MLTVKHSHSQYQNFIKTRLDKVYIQTGQLPYKAEGIYTDIIPGVGTFYDFMDRLIRKDRNIYKSKLRRFKRKPRKKQKKNQKMDSSKPGVVERLVKSWDSFNKQYYYGHTFHGFTACDSFYSLPIHIKFVSAARHDSVTGVYALKELVDLYLEIKFYSAAFDSAYDASVYYSFNMHFGINPIIDLNSRSSQPSAKNEFVVLDKNGIPHGKFCGHQLRNWEIVSKEYRHKWLFPVQCECCDRNPMKSNHTYYTKTTDNPRYFTSIPPVESSL